MKKILPGLLLMLIGCSPRISVRTDYDPDYDLWTYKTFGWDQKVDTGIGKDPFYYNEVNDRRIRSAVQDQLTSRGYLLTDKQPDLVLHYHIIAQDGSTLVTEPYEYTYSACWLQMESNVYSYREGTLIVDLMDAKTNHLVWRGWAVSPLQRSYRAGKIDRLIKTAVTRIFKKFPKNRSRASVTNGVVSN